MGDGEVEERRKGNITLSETIKAEIMAAISLEMVKMRYLTSVRP